MLTVRARVRNGRLVVDEPTTLPEGTEVALATIDEKDDQPWQLSTEQRTELKARLASSDSATLVPATDVFARLRTG